MRFYGNIESNMDKLYKDNGIEDSHFNYSVDSLLFESDDGVEFSIDFEEGDFSTTEEGLSFRLKSMGCTFSDTWNDLDIKSLDNIENDSGLFSNSRLKTIVLYLPEHDKIDNALMSKLEFKVVRSTLFVGNNKIEYDISDTIVEAYNG